MQRPTAMFYSVSVPSYTSTAFATTTQLFSPSAVVGSLIGLFSHTNTLGN
eukprot:m.160119 g.160119  ORF g.160119 m.160119 type:complete len:50 (-) comp13380_c1_seq9:2466-2615(-)